MHDVFVGIGGLVWFSISQTVSASSVPVDHYLPSPLRDCLRYKLTDHLFDHSPPPCFRHITSHRTHLHPWTLVPTSRDLETCVIHHHDRRIIVPVHLEHVMPSENMEHGTDLDRANVANAYVSGMKEELNMVGNQYNVSSLCFSVHRQDVRVLVECGTDAHTYPWL